MSSVESVVDLGFAQARVPRGAHICQIYSADEERDQALLKFITKGLTLREATACFSDKMDPKVLAAWLLEAGFEMSHEQASGHLSFSGADAVYFEDDVFEPPRMIERLRQFRLAAIEAGLAGARVIGEMSPRIHQVEGGARLFEYESKVNELLREHPVIAVCQYDARIFGGSIIMDVLSVHPLMVVHGAVIQNPFFIAPETLARA